MVDHQKVAMTRGTGRFRYGSAESTGHGLVVFTPQSLMYGWRCWMTLPAEIDRMSGPQQSCWRFGIILERLTRVDTTVPWWLNWSTTKRVSPAKSRCLTRLYFKLCWSIQSRLAYLNTAACVRHPDIGNAPACAYPQPGKNNSPGDAAYTCTFYLL